MEHIVQKMYMVCHLWWEILVFSITYNNFPPYLFSDVLFSSKSSFIDIFSHVCFLASFLTSSRARAKVPDLPLEITIYSFGHFSHPITPVSECSALVRTSVPSHPSLRIFHGASITCKVVFISLALVP